MPRSHVAVEGAPCLGATWRWRGGARRTWEARGGGRGAVLAGGGAERRMFLSALGRERQWKNK